MPGNENIVNQLTHELHPLRVKLDAILVDEFAAGFARWKLERKSEQPPREELRRDLIDYMWNRLDELRRELGVLEQLLAVFTQRYTGAVSEIEKKEHILSFARGLGSSGTRLKKDEKAFSRWFGADAVMDRYRRRVAAIERRMVFGLERIGVLTEAFLLGHANDRGIEKSWRQLKTESLVAVFLSHQGDRRVRIEAFKCLARSLKAVPAGLVAESVLQSTLQFVFRAALDRQQHVWIQSEALELLEKISVKTLEKALKNRFEDHSGKDDIFVRSRAVRLLCNNTGRFTDIKEHLLRAAKDPDAHVRQSLAEALIHAGDRYLKYWLQRLATSDPSPQVRAAAILKVAVLIEREAFLGYCLKMMVQVLDEEKNSFVIRVALKVCADCQTLLARPGFEAEARQWYTFLVPRIERLHQQANDLSVRRWSAQYRERMWCVFYPPARKLKYRLLEAVAKIKPGKQKRFSGKLLGNSDDKLVGRVLSVITQEDFGVGIRKEMLGVRLYRDYNFDFRFWRFIYEIIHPSPDKRQAFNHNIGRIFHGTIHAPSAILSELAMTKVPGEPLFMPGESGWRPYLPLVDQVLSAVKNAGFFGTRQVRIFTSEGETRVMPPRSFLKRWWALLNLTFRFPHFARLRNWDENSMEDPRSYVGAFRRIGILIAFFPHETRKGAVLGDPAVLAFFRKGEKK